MVGEQAQTSQVPLDFVFTSSQGQYPKLAVPLSPDFDDKTVTSGIVDLTGDVCNAVKQEGAYAPPSGDRRVDVDELDASSSEESSDDEEDDYSDDEDSEDDDNMDDDEIDVDVL
jgi:hypothetical protein